MKEKNILYKTAKMAREKGFTCESDAFWRDGLSYSKKDYNPTAYQYKENVATQDQLQTWLRNEWDIQVNVIRENDYWTPVLIFISRENLEEQIPSISKSFETALEVGLEYALKSIRTK